MGDIRDLSQHFNQPDGDISPWMFIPEDNIKKLSAAEHPGLLTIWQNGQEKDIKGVLKDPIRMDEYRMPWQFQMCLAQNYAASLLGMGDAQQNNYAIGFNLAVTFSDPALWPENRDELPPDTHSMQLFVVHLGSTGEFSEGLPQFATDLKETFLVWGRGDLAEDNQLAGNWNIPYIFSQNMPYYGPASPQLYFCCDAVNETTLRVGIKFEAKHDHIIRKIDCSKYGKITGIWEIGPIFACDRWIPDTLCKQLPVVREIEHPPVPKITNPVFEFYVDYCVFMYRHHAAPLEHNSDDFDIPGYMGKLRALQIPYSAETWSHPGHLNITLLGPSQGCWFFSNNLYDIDLRTHVPPWEIEICFHVPDDSAPWNLHFQLRIEREDGKVFGYWQPGVMNFPEEQRHRYVNYSHGKHPTFNVAMDYYLSTNFGLSLAEYEQFKQRVNSNVVFDVPEEILANKPLYMLFQMVDRSRVRIGFKARKEDSWFLSNDFDLGKLIGGNVGVLAESNFGITTGNHWDLPPGSPMYQTYLIDYIYYRYGISQERNMP